MSMCGTSKRKMPHFFHMGGFTGNISETVNISETLVKHLALLSGYVKMATVVLMAIVSETWVFFTSPRKKSQSYS